MGSAADIRSRSFPYRRKDATVTRLPHGWRIAVGAKTCDGHTLVDAFEALLDRHLGDAEMAVVVAALEWHYSFDETPAA